jgi:hypothetical protein
LTFSDGVEAAPKDIQRINIRLIEKMFSESEGIEFGKKQIKPFGAVAPLKLLYLHFMYKVWLICQTCSKYQVDYLYFMEPTLHALH